MVIRLVVIRLVVGVTPSHAVGSPVASNVKRATVAH